ncbi:formylmethanofurane dehydrogenase subunit, putative [Fulvimarina pelagi HTCC2506]|uniref:Formylmethanofurane dehydrogenase subunit, putative n=1 Tax=Fulvimarina pelagi HTCC2506 TaxID=314231 RepID=Q0G4K6_9HYPH|nr:formylmethanofuran dehydrogenase subunit C [Fulvimarina pelagi]EAU41475.1 formylmethanofurane dehydrogenase subunit, putative [Fulvimarina pelagi HTCC2506]
MSALTFRLKGEPDERIDCSSLVPDRLKSLGSSEIEKLPVGTTKRGLVAGDVFEISGDDAADIRFEGGSSRLDRIGERMSEGAIRVSGDAGFRVGRVMSGGDLQVEGSVGDLCGSGLEGGCIRVKGDCGAKLGGPDAGEMKGMSGGTIRVHGNAGERAGDRMRRGTILIDGDCGKDAASRMIAGTLIVGGHARGAPGRLMKRGTLLLMGGAERFTPTFVDAGVHDLLILKLMADGLRETFGDVPFDGSAMRKMSGDTAVLGLGEVYLPA